MRDTRVIYVENDAALRGIVARALAQADGLELLLATSSPHEALEGNLIEQADAALVDLALGLDVPNGIDLGIAMRERNPNIGIVVYSQYSLRNVARRVPENLRMGWAFMSKSGDMRVDDLVDVLRSTAQGLAQPDTHRSDEETGPNSLLDELSPRQRAVMALAASGLTAPEIAVRLGVTHDAVRKDLSKAYRLLVPAGEGGDLRTRAVLAYLQLVRDQSWDELST